MMTSPKPSAILDSLTYEINNPTNIEKPKASFKSLSKNRKKEQRRKRR